jgi:hypothetical protein
MAYGGEGRIRAGVQQDAELVGDADRVRRGCNGPAVHRGASTRATP